MQLVPIPDRLPTLAWVASSVVWPVEQVPEASVPLKVTEVACQVQCWCDPGDECGWGGGWLQWALVAS